MRNLKLKEDGPKQTSSSWVLSVDSDGVNVIVRTKGGKSFTTRLRSPELLALAVDLIVNSSSVGNAVNQFWRLNS